MAVTSFEHGLVGRDPDVATLSRFVNATDTPATRARMLLLTGDPGVGKSALLDAVTNPTSTRGHLLVLRAAGVQAGVELGFAGLSELLAPVMDQIVKLPAPQQASLLAALDHAGGSSTMPDGVSSAVAKLLTSLSRHKPVVVIVDDAQWLDRATADLMGRVMRNLDSRTPRARVRFLVVRRSGTPSLLDHHEHDTHVLQPLAEDAARRLTRSKHPEIAGRVLERVLAESLGNPLALMELPAALSVPQQRAHTPLPTHLPLTQRLQSLFGSRVQQLPSETRELLLWAALGQDDVVLPVASWTERERILAPAIAASLVADAGPPSGVRFRHPLVRSTVIELSTGADRRRAHQVLAAAYQPGDDRAAWHLAASTGTPDEQVAQLLELAAHRAWRRGDAVGAVHTLVRAAEMSPAGDARARRYAAAAYQGADVVGDLSGASRLLRHAQGTDARATKNLQAAMATSYLLLNGSGDTHTAHRILVQALEATASVSADEERTLAEAVHNLCEISLYAADEGLWPEYHAAAGRAPVDRFPVLDLWNRLMVDPARTAASALLDLEAALDHLVTETDPVKIERIATAGVFVDRITMARGPLLRLADDARAGGTVTAGIMAVMLLSFEAFYDGDWDSAGAWSDEGIDWCRQHGFGLLSWPLQLSQALLAAAQGDSAAVQQITDRMRNWATPRRVGTVLHYAAHAQALDALGRGDYESAFRAVSTISPPGELPPHRGHALWVPLLLVEAAVHAGHEEAAREHVAAMESAGVDRLSPRLALRLNGARAIASPTLDRGLFDQALRTPQARASPFELARIQLRYGQKLRRSRAATEARNHLQDALVAFRRLSAAPWVAQTEEELQATAPAKYTSRTVSGTHLTAQELRVAKLAADGLTNRQIGQRLLISTRTVGTHLQSAFAKLAVHNRAGLARALADGAPEGPS